MAWTSVQFTAEDAPCGKLVTGRRRRDIDNHGLILENLTYACGCRYMYYQFHDGSGRARLVRHDGRVLMDERSPERGE